MASLHFKTCERILLPLFPSYIWRGGGKKKRDFFDKLNAKTRKYTAYGHQKNIIEKTFQNFCSSVVCVCPCTAVFGNCYFWAIIDLAWWDCALYKQTIIMTRLHFGQNRENFVCTLNCNCTRKDQRISKLSNSSVNFSKMLEKWCLKLKFSRSNYSLFASFFTRTSRAA